VSPGALRPADHSVEEQPVDRGRIEAESVHADERC
jgi:hypothetical protein